MIKVTKFGNILQINLTLEAGINRFRTGATRVCKVLSGSSVEQQQIGIEVFTLFILRE